jgi:hypothetical protein
MGRKASAPLARSVADQSRRADGRAHPVSAACLYLWQVRLGLPLRHRRFRGASAAHAALPPGRPDLSHHRRALSLFLQ